MTYHPITCQITTLLTENGCWFETFEHEPVRTSEEAARTRPGYTLRQGAKAIVVRLGSSQRGDSFAMLVMPADVRFDSKKVRQMLGVRTLRFATGEEIDQLTGGVLPGAIPPFGTLFGLPVYADAGIFENE
ncbi:MAG TPA: YbaK/EbsC family protein, partial [Ardenticatenaceae bacterium]|nr:YbaK/EbsC family protein [Ardenticatenaceae bacterium]